MRNVHTLLGYLARAAFALALRNSTKTAHRTGPGQRTILNVRPSRGATYRPSKAGSTDCSLPYVRPAA